MAIAPSSQTRQLGQVSVLMPAPRPGASALAQCLKAVERDWRRDGHLAALWQAWPGIAGPQLAPHCRPLRLQGGILWVGVEQPQWLLALRYSRHQLLGALRASGFPLKDLQLEQRQQPAAAAVTTNINQASWDEHPSRVDRHGMGSCSRCGAPAPMGEMQRWGHCSFCQRQMN